jgi:CRP/FNR family transcriptional regulator
MEALDQVIEFKSSPELVEQLYKHGILKNYKAGSVILSEHAAIRSIPIVIKASVKVKRTEEDGRHILLYYIKSQCR